MTTMLASLVVVASLTFASPLVTGHRGGGSESRRNPTPENTLPSIAQGFADGADLVEVDVQLDMHGDPILWHNKHVRVDGRKIPVREVAQADFPPVVGPTGIKARVPLFDDALRLALELGCCQKVMDVELKVHEECDRSALAKAVVGILLEANATDRVIVTSLDEEILKRVECMLPCMETGLIVVRTFGNWQSLREECRSCPSWVEWVIVRDAALLQGSGARNLVEDAHRRGLRIGFWTVNRLRRMRILSAAGADMLITDELQTARSLLPCRCCPRASTEEIGLVDPNALEIEMFDPGELKFETKGNRE